MATANKTLEGYGRKVPGFRMKGALAAGVTFAPGDTKKERVYVGGLESVRVRVKLSAIVGTVTATVYPMLSDAGADDTAGTRGAAFAAGTAITTTGEAVIDITLRGEVYAEVELALSGGVTDAATVDYVEISGVPHI